MKISVLINNYNYGKYIHECLDGLLAQKREADEIIVVDDGSTDDSLERIRAHPLKVTCIAQKNQGQFAAMAAATKIATGDIYCYLDADDIWKPNYLEEVESAFNSHHAPDFVFTGLEKFGNDTGHVENGHFSSEHFYPKSRQIVLTHDLYLGSPTSANSMRAEPARRLVEILPTDQIENFRICGDIILVMGASIIGCSKLCIPKLLVNYRTHANNGHYGKENDKSWMEADKLRRTNYIALTADTIGLQGSIPELANEFIQQLKWSNGKTFLIKKYLRSPKKMGAKSLRLQYWKYYFKWLRSWAQRTKNT